MNSGNLVALVHRHPRYIVLLLFLLACSTLILIPWPSGASFDGYLPSKFRGSMSLEEFVAREELRYANLLADRQDLIEHYGPKPDQVDS